MLRNMDDISETCGSFFLALLLVFTFGGADDHQLTWEICWIPDGDGHVDAGDLYVRRCWTHPRTRPVSPGLQKNVNMPKFLGYNISKYC